MALDRDNRAGPPGSFHRIAASSSAMFFCAPGSSRFPIAANDPFNSTLVSSVTAAGQLDVSSDVLYRNCRADAEFAIQLTAVASLEGRGFRQEVQDMTRP